MSPLTTVMLGTSLLGCIAGVVGTFAVLRRRALVGDLLAHAALPGLCLAFLIAGRQFFVAMVVGAFITGLAGVALVTVITRWTRTKEDAAIGIVLSTFFGAGVVLSSVIQNLDTSSGKAGLETYIYGQAAGMVQRDVYLIGGVAIVALGLVIAYYKEFKVLSFDAEFAQVQGWPTLGLDLGMMALVAVVTVVGLQAVGVVLIAAMLITPAAAARLWSNRLGTMTILAGAFGALAALVGTLLSSGVVTEKLGFDPLAFGYNTANLPTGPLIVLSGTAVFLFSLCFAPQRGIISRALTHLRLRIRTAQENLLRTLYELSEERLPETPPIAVAELLKRRSWKPWEANLLLRWAERRGFIGRLGDGVQLTHPGLVRAAELTRRHRLWELFLIQGANVAPDHVDRDADDIEHILPPAVLAQLEAELAAAGRLPRDERLPSSPHELSPALPGSEASHV